MIYVYVEQNSTIVSKAIDFTSKFKLGGGGLGGRGTGSSEVAKFY